MDDMTIRRATAADIPQIDELLRQVLEVHHAGRPDLFKGGVKKYTDEELKAILANDQTLYIDDLCVDERSRGHHVGSTLYRYVLDFARQSGCHNVTLNVWACNPKAQAFYERMGLTPYYIGMEQVL